MMHHQRTVDPVAGEWSRRRLLAVLAGVVAGAVLLIGGLSYAVVAATSPTHPDADTTSAVRRWPVRADGTRGAAYRDALAAKPMLRTTQADMEPSAPALATPRRMVIGQSTKTGPVGVATGFAHTPQGAVGQLAAIEVATLTPMSLAYARDVYTQWSARPKSAHAHGFRTWEIAQSIQTFQAHAGVVDGDGSVSLVAVPVGAQIKGTDGGDWVLACVQLDVTVTVAAQTRFGFGHCERMQWTGTRWMIAAGTPPAAAPSTWPGSQRSLDAGWRQWVNTDGLGGTGADEGDDR